MGSLAGSKILVVESEFVIAIDYQVLLWRFGCTVLGPAASVAEALVLLRHERPDAALVDVRLADGRATPVVKALKAAEVPFALVTARGATEPPEPSLGGAPCLTKPCDGTTLHSALEELLAVAGTASRLPPARRGTSVQRSRPGTRAVPVSDNPI